MKSFKLKVILLPALLIFISFLFNSCRGTHIVSRNVNYLEKGMSFELVDDLVGVSHDDLLSFTHDGNEISVYLYDMSYYFSSSITRYTDSQGNTSSTREIVNFTTDFVLLFVNDKLHNVFWLSDINKVEDQLTNKLTDKIVELYFELEGIE